MLIAADETRVGAHGSVITRVARIAAWLAGIALVLFVLDLLGVPVADWIRELFKEIRAVPIQAVVGGVALDTLQTGFAAVTCVWFAIARVGLRLRPSCADRCPGARSGVAARAGRSLLLAPCDEAPQKAQNRRSDSRPAPPVRDGSRAPSGPASLRG